MLFPAPALTPDHLRRPNGDSDGQGRREDQLWKLAPFESAVVGGWVDWVVLCLPVSYLAPHLLWLSSTS